MAAKLCDSPISILSFSELCSKPFANSKKDIDISSLNSDWTDSIYFHEEIIIAELCCELDIADPFTLLKSYFKEFHELGESVKNVAWILITDRFLILKVALIFSFNLDCCIRYTAKEIAAGALYMAHEIEGEDLPSNFWNVIAVKEAKLGLIRSKLSKLYS